MNEDSDVMYRLLVQSVVDYAIYMLTPEGNVANWNPGAQRAKGYRPDEIVGKNFSCFYSTQDRLDKVPEKNLATAYRTGRFEEQAGATEKTAARFGQTSSLMRYAMMTAS